MLPKFYFHFDSEKRRLERLEIDQERREKRERQQYKHQRDRAILVLTENARERQKREDMEFLENKLKERKEFLISEIKRYRKDPHNFDRNNSEIFGTKKGLTEEGLFYISQYSTH